ncbi:LOW QUALITY PROTEIN: hypothetical protein QTO34_013083 [Cnephaeus nilssonii]|uniref:Integrase catalytic domain-containing protein n=1 Tax=Cnephaeus nilssonii TaxID=3371016 RepID=A0AA40HB99_CNENI|nr:LOW QUALITY PROTEIN: hypothetical protein QTO34_013083 [Eptesicus nilssonii]
MGVLTQPLGPAFTPVASLSRQLDPTALDAAAALTKEAQICLQQPLQTTGSSVTLILISPCPLSHAGTPAPVPRESYISLTQYPARTPATLLPAASTQPAAKHSCPEVVEALTLPQAGLSDLPLSNPDFNFVCGWKLMPRPPQGRQKASYAVVTLERTLEVAQLPEGTTSQKVELIALTRALHLAKGRRVAIVHCRGQQTDSLMVTRGNTRADAVARGLTQVYRRRRRKNKLLQWGGSSGPEGWIFINNKIALPKAQVHWSLHIGPLALWRFLEPLFTSPTLREAVTSACSSCSTCAAVSPQGGMRPNFPTHQMRDTSQGRTGRLHPYASPQEAQISAYHGRHPDRVVEAFSIRKETAEVVAETLITHIIPRFGLPTSIQSGNSPVFISRVVQQVSTSLGISWKLHIPYRLQSSGKIERVNGLLKDHLTKLSLEIRSSWPDFLSMALTRIRATPRSPTFLSPLELPYGRPFLLNHRLPTDPPLLALIFHTCLYSGSCSGNMLTGFCPGQNQLTKAPEDQPSSQGTQSSLRIYIPRPWSPGGRDLTQ